MLSNADGDGPPLFGPPGTRETLFAGALPLISPDFPAVPATVYWPALGIRIGFHLFRVGHKLSTVMRHPADTHAVLPSIARYWEPVHRAGVPHRERQRSGRLLNTRDCGYYPRLRVPRSWPKHVQSQCSRTGAVFFLSIVMAGIARTR